MLYNAILKISLYQIKWIVKSIYIYNFFDLDILEHKLSDKQNDMQVLLHRI